MLRQAARKAFTQWLEAHPEALELDPEERRLREEGGWTEWRTPEEQCVDSVCHQMEYCKVRVIDDAPCVTIDTLLGPFYGHLEVVGVVEAAVRETFQQYRVQLLEEVTRAQRALQRRGIRPQDIELTPPWRALVGHYFLGLRVSECLKNRVLGDGSYHDLELPKKES